jgi:hypothetical protein
MIVQKGHLPDFSQFTQASKPRWMCWALPKWRLSTQYSITYVLSACFVVPLLDCDMCFERREKQYLANWAKLATSMWLRREWESFYEEWSAVLYEFICTAAYPSMKEAFFLLKDSNLLNVLNITYTDVVRAFHSGECAEGKIIKGSISIVTRVADRLFFRTGPVRRSILHLWTGSDRS